MGGVVGNASSSKLRRLRANKSIVHGKTYTGGIADHAGGDNKRLNAYKLKVIEESCYVGGVAGFTGTMKRCSFRHGEVVAKSYGGGWIVGQAYSSAGSNLTFLPLIGGSSVQVCVGRGGAYRKAENIEYFLNILSDQYSSWNFKTIWKQKNGDFSRLRI